MAHGSPVTRSVPAFPSERQGVVSPRVEGPASVLGASIGDRDQGPLMQKPEWPDPIRPRRLLGLAAILFASVLALPSAHAEDDDDTIAIASLSPGENINTLVDLSRETADIVLGLTARRSNLVIGTLPTTGDRSDRLRGIIDIAKSPKPFFDALPDFAAGKPVPFGASVRAYDKMVGNEQPSPFDAWIKGTFALLPTSGTAGQFGALAVGIDQLVTSDFLVGGFAQGDGLLRDENANSPLARGGWTLGGYGTWRITDNFYVDTLAGHGSSLGIANPKGLGTGQFETGGWIVTSALAGDWAMGNWKFTPKARFRYFEEASISYAAQEGMAAATSQGSIGEFAFSPAVSYLLTTDQDISVETGLKFETATGIDATKDLWSTLADFNGRLEGSMIVKLPTGVRIKSTFGYGGIGTINNSIALKTVFNAPIP
jgi:hypothetical protein